MRILVTGGAGFIGSHICDHALSAGHEVAALDDLSSGKRENLPDGVRFYEVDIRDREATRKAMADFSPEAVSHQAAQASVSVSMQDPALDAAVNVLGGIHVAESAEEVGCNRLVFASTGGAIYGNVPQGQAAGESWTPDPQSPYAIHKYTFEKLLMMYETEGRLSPTVLRYANVFGPRQDPHGEAGVVAIFFNRAFAQKPLQVNALAQQGDDGCTRDYTFVSDVARANIAALEGRLPERLMNVGTGVATSTRWLAESIKELSGSSCEVTSGPHRAGDVGHSTLDPSRFKKALGDTVTLKEGLQTTRDWYESNA